MYSYMKALTELFAVSAPAPYRHRYVRDTALIVVGTSLACGRAVPVGDEASNVRTDAVTHSMNAITASPAEPGTDFAIAYDGVRTTVTDSLPAVSRRADVAPPVLKRPPSSPGTVPTFLPLRDRIRALALGKSPATLLPLTIILDELATDWTQFRNSKTEAERASLVAERAARTGTAQAPLITWLRANGAQNIKSQWLANLLFAEVPAGAVEGLLARPDVRDVSPVNIPVGPTYNGVELKSALRINNAYNMGFDSHLGGRRGGRIRIGVIEVDPINSTNWVNQSHVGWKRSANGTNRLVVKDCATSLCPLTTQSSSGQSWNHANIVTWIAGGSIESGQDTYYAPPNDGAFSGLSRNTYIFYYNAHNLPGVWNALQAAVQDAMDVVNLSFSTSNSSTATANVCDPYTNSDGINEAIANVTNAGTLVVVGAGNGERQGTCTIGWPAIRSEALAVGALNSAAGQAYGVAPMSPESSDGGFTAFLHGSGQGVHLSGIGVSAPGKVENYFDTTSTSGPFGYVTATRAGTSIASPAAAAVAGALRSAFWYTGSNLNNARSLLVNSLLVADGWDAISGSQLSIGLSARSGAGRMRFHAPTTQDLPGGAWGWSVRSFNIVQNELVEWHPYPWTYGSAIPTGVTQWKAAMGWTESNLGSIADIDFYVDDTCHSTRLASDFGYDTRTKFRITGGLPGRCLKISAHGYRVPPGESRTVYAADYYHSGPTQDH